MNRWSTQQPRQEKWLLRQLAARTAAFLGYVLKDASRVPNLICKTSGIFYTQILSLAIKDKKKELQISGKSAFSALFAASCRNAQISRSLYLVGIKTRRAARCKTPGWGCLGSGALCDITKQAKWLAKWNLQMSKICTLNLPGRQNTHHITIFCNKGTLFRKHIKQTNKQTENNSNPIFFSLSASCSFSQQPLLAVLSTISAQSAVRRT